MIKLFLLNLFARNLDSIIALFTKLDQQLDAYIAKEQSQLSSLDKMISDLTAQKQDKLQNIDRAGRIQSNVQSITK